MSTILKVQDLNVRFRQDGETTHAVRGVSFVVEKGETVALVGESGSGKSVTALSTVQLLGDSAQADGSITYMGQEMIGASERDLQAVRGNDISFIFQEPMTSLNPLHTIERQLTESIELHQGLRGPAVTAKIIELLEQVGIRDATSRLGAYPHQLSGGQRQRVMIAMALANKPDVLIADEPTTALDVTIQAQILELVKELRQKLGMAIIWITHDLGVIAAIADRVMVMYGGTVVESASTPDLFQTRAHPYTQGLFAARPQLGLKRGTRLQTIPGNVPEIFNWPQGCAFADRCPHAEASCRMAVPLPEQIHAHPNSDSSSMQTHDHWVSCLKWQQLEASV